MIAILGTHGARLGVMRLGLAEDVAAAEVQVQISRRLANWAFVPPPGRTSRTRLGPDTNVAGGTPPRGGTTNWGFVPFPGTVIRGQAPNPSDQTPIQPPARRVPPIDWMPVNLGNRVTRRMPRPIAQATPPRLSERRSGSSFPFIPEPGRTRRGRPLHSDVGGNLAVMLSRQVKAGEIPLPGRVSRSLAPKPPIEPQVLPRRSRTIREAIFGVAQLGIRPKPRCFPKSASASPALPELCEYKPGRLDEADYLPTRIDECS